MHTVPPATDDAAMPAPASPSPAYPPSLQRLVALLNAGDLTRAAPLVTRAGPLGLLLRALALARAGQVADARRDVVQALAASPESAIGHEIAGLILQATHDHARALAALERAAVLAPRTASRPLARALSLTGQLGWEQEAHALLRRLEMLEPTEARWPAARARLLARRRLHAEAAAAARQALAHSPLATELWLLAAQEAAEAGDPAAATEAARNAWTSAPPAARAVVGLAGARALREAGSFAESAATLHGVLASEPATDVAAAAHAWLGEFALWGEDTATALHHAQASLAALPTAAACRLHARLAADPANANAWLERAVGLDPRDAEAWFLRAERHLRNDDRNACHADLDRGMWCVGGHPLAAWLLRERASLPDPGPAIASVRFGEIREGLETLTEDSAAVLATGDPVALADLLDRALVRLRSRGALPVVLDQGRLQRLPCRTAPRHASRLVLEAVRVLPPDELLHRFDALVARWPDAPLPVCHRGELQLWLGDTASARRDLDRALALSPRTRWAWIGLGACDLLDGDPVAALEALAEGVRRMADTEGPAVFLYRGEARLRLGQREAVSGRDEAARTHLLAAQGDLERALAERPMRIAGRIVLALVRHALDDFTSMDKDFADLRERAPGLLSDAGRAAGLDVWRAPGWQPEPQAAAAILESALVAMRGNRSSTCTTWFTPDGVLRAVPNDAHGGIRDRGIGAALAEAEHLLARVAAIREQ